MNERKKAEAVKKEKDYYFPVIVSQMICCAFMVAVFFFVKGTQQWQQIKMNYADLLKEDFLTTEFTKVVSGVKNYLLSKDSVFVVFNNKVQPYTEESEVAGDERAGEKTEGQDAFKENKKESISRSVEDNENVKETKNEAATSYEVSSSPVFLSESVSQIAVPAVKVATVPLQLVYSEKKKMLSPLSEGRYTSYFGERTDPITEGSDYHKGIDIGADEGDRIRAVYDGVVSATGEDSRSGKYVFLTHEKGIETFYCHCSKILVKEGERVSQGESIALVGSTGYSTGPHLHFEVRINGTSVDPLPLLEDAD